MKQMNSLGKLRLMRIEDIEEVFRIEELCFHTPWSKESFQQELSKNALARYLVYEYGGRIVAYAGIWLILFEGHVTNIAVHPDFRRQGFGRMIAEAILRLARCYDITAMTLEVRPTNEAALSLYHSLGFVVCGVRPGYYSDTNEDAVIMWKRDLTSVAIDEEECRHVFGRCVAGDEDESR